MVNQLLISSQQKTSGTQHSYLGFWPKVLAKSADEMGLESKMLQFFYNILWQRRLNNITVYELSQYSIPLIDIGGLHLPLLALLFVYQFNSRIGLLVCSSFAND